MGINPFNWEEALEQKYITEQEWKEMDEMASGWITCASGQQCCAIPREANGKPKDARLANLAGEFGFAGAIQDRDARQALVFLYLIECRASDLIDQITLSRN